MSFKIAVKVTKYFGYFCKKICHQEMSKIAQSGLTGLGLLVSFPLPCPTLDIGEKVTWLWCPWYQSVWPEKSPNLPKNDFTRRMKETSALNCGWFGKNNCCHRLWKVAQSATNKSPNLVTPVPMEIGQEKFKETFLRFPHFPLVKQILKNLIKQFWYPINHVT